MSQGRPTEELLNRLLAAAAAGAGKGEVGQLIAAALAEAWAETKDLIRSAATAALLRQAVAELEQRGLSPITAAPDAVSRENDAHRAEGESGAAQMPGSWPSQ